MARNIITIPTAISNIFIMFVGFKIPSSGDDVELTVVVISAPVVWFVELVAPDVWFVVLVVSAEEPSCFISCSIGSEWIIRNTTKSKY